MDTSDVVGIYDFGRIAVTEEDGQIVVSKRWYVTSPEAAHEKIKELANA